MTNTLQCYWREINLIDKRLSQLRKLGLGPGDAIYNVTWKARGMLFGQMGFRRPSIPSLIKLLARLSPGVIRLWEMGERGYVVEARAHPQAPPVYHSVDVPTAVAIAAGKLTHDLEAELMKPDEYIGE